ncbi:hypothetical protein F2Q68_00017065 [Brassica cretica]|uniref:Uncharacterized protein n=1 Tax=Brassica cretica TaxID=69181 RepID=A0A8S9HGH6_BRACR|nr:hypothetical protein F2Q68_00017065 [Brassica cretica]
MEEELRDMKAHKSYYNMLHFVANAQQGIPKLCPYGSITKEVVDEEDTYDYLPGRRYFICKDYENDGMHFRQPWVMGMQQEVERLKERFHEQEKLLRECEALKQWYQKSSTREAPNPETVLFSTKGTTTTNSDTEIVKSTSSKP